VAPRFDTDSSTLELAVADLLDTQLLRSLGFANRGGYERMWLGQAIHSRYQQQALEEDPTYRREVTVRHTFEHHGWQVTVHGRIDGLRRGDDGERVVEEIKSVRRDSRLAPNTRQIYERQASLYAWMLAQSEPEPQAPPIRAELLLIEIGSEHLEREPVEVDLDLLGALVRRRINHLLRRQQASRQEFEERRAAATQLAFPYTEERPGQSEISSAVAAAVTAGEHLLVAAPTGIGKTVATILPVLRYALEHNKRVFVLTAKNLQQTMATTVLQLLNQDQSFRTLQLRAKSRMCANGEMLCHEEYCEFAKEYYQKLHRSEIVSRLLDQYGTLLPDDIFAAARNSQVCPFEVSLELSGQAQVTVCDYNYAFDPYVALSDFGPDASLEGTILIVDEIHNLVDRGRGYYSPRLTSRQAFEAGEEVALGLAPIHRTLARLCYRLEKLIEETVADAQPAGEEHRWAAEQALPEDALHQLRGAFDQAFVDYLEHRRETKTLTADDRFVDLYFGLLKFLNALSLSNDSFSHYVERRDQNSRLCILCRDPSQFLGKTINRCHAVVGLSATLSPHEFYRDLLGFDPARTEPLRIGNPFPAENRRVVIDTSVATTWRERPANYPRIADGLSRFADAVPGNCLALFPSYKFLAEVASMMGPDSKRVLVQNSGDSAQQREEILDTLRTAIFGDVLLLAVAGGVFAEGVDYPGEMLKAVAVVGPCLPPVTLDQKLLQTYYDERFDRGFEYAFVVPGMTRVVQAAGRLIRSAHDTGVIALFDRRFLRRPYKDHLPADWHADDVGQLAGRPHEVTRDFFASITP